MKKVFEEVKNVRKTLPQKISTAEIYQTTVSFADVPAGMSHYALLINGEKVDAKKMGVK